MAKMRYVKTGFLVLFVAAFLLVAGCGQSKQAAETGTRTSADGQAMGEEDSSQVTQEPQDTQGPVTLTLYFMGSTPTSFYLVPEKRTVPYTQAVARAAMEELIKGPAAGSSLAAILPDTVKVLDVSVSDGVCTVNLSKEILTDKAKAGGAGAEVEGLALASIANTLTEFPTIQKVKLLVEGEQSGTVDGFYIEDFWGHVGLDEYLVRNMSVVKAPN
jgi:germination protein M